MKGYFGNVHNKKVINISKDSEGSKVTVTRRTNTIYQRFKIVYVDRATKDITKGMDSNFGFHINRPFYLRSRLPMKRVAEVVGTDIRLRRYTTSRVKQQMYTFDRVSKTIKSQYHTSYSIEISGNGTSSNLRVTTTNSRWWQLFRRRGAFIMNERGKVMDVHGGRDEENRNVIVWKKHGGLNQQWDVVYKWKAEPKDGQFNKDFGLTVGRTFTLRTLLRSGRNLDIIGR
jgi:hypothetical protein